ncbi:transketolase [Inquilinus limosus]|uniref:transketolase n=1 Tax=Inquilinus limosus TaxID=171674 RepID=UPI003F18A505
MSDSPRTVTHSDMANAIRFLSMDAVEAAKSGHPGMPMGMADVATVLFSRYLKFDAAAPTWADRDRFILSGGHGSMLLYSLMYLTGNSKITLDEIKRFRQLGSHTAGHPEVDHDAGIETTTGPLGQGLGNAVGFALAERILNVRFGDDLVNHHTWVTCGDGDLEEGISHEACSLAGHLKLGRLIVFYDDNSITIDGPTKLSFSDDTQKRFEAYGWHVQRIDGHDTEAIAAAIDAALADQRPSLIACKTIIGWGAPNKQGTSATHGSPLGKDEVAAAREHLGWTYPPFEVPEATLVAWREIGRRGEAERLAWDARLLKTPAETRAAFRQAMTGALPSGLDGILAKFKAETSEAKPSLATRVASGQVLELLVPAIPELIGGSADLTPSNNTKTKVSTDIEPGKYDGRYVRYGVREHGMAAAMNGLALHGGIIPYGATFLTFTDYARPSIRLAALMRQRVVFVMTHDSIGLGEDGPTHQPVEHVAALRAIPHLLVFRPCDAVETAEAWQIALETEDAPSVLALTRQNLPTLRRNANAENLSAKGGYILEEATGTPRVLLIATGSEVAIAKEARDALEAEGIGTRLVSMPCTSLFDRQPSDYRRRVLGQGVVRIAVEAGVRQGWDHYIGPEGAFVGMTGFGASGPYDQLYKHFGITAEAVVAAAKAKL